MPDTTGYGRRTYGVGRYGTSTTSTGTGTGEYGHSDGYGYGHTPYGHGLGTPTDIGGPVTAYGRKHRYGEQWGMCAVCGFMYPYSNLRIQPGDKGGHIVCVTLCLDEPSIMDLLPDELPTERPLLFIEEGGPSE